MNPAALLPTVRSRCIELKMRPVANPCEQPDNDEHPDTDTFPDTNDPPNSDTLPDANDPPDSGTLPDTDEPADADDLVSDFIDALDGDNVLLAKCMFRLDKLDRFAFSDFLTSAREQILLSLREMPSHRSSAYAEGVLTKAGEMLDLNVSTGHISGMICASLLKLES